MLSESQIQRYARQVLLHDVGERGQEALGAVRVELAVGGEIARAAAAYLRAGGTEVNAEGSPGPWAGTPPLLGSAPSRLVAVTAAPDVPAGEGIAVGQRPGAHVLWSLGRDGCPACIRTASRELRPPAARSVSAVQVGTLLALLVQRRALGVAPPMEGVEVSDTGVLSTLAAAACTHQPPVVPPGLLAELLRHLAAALPDEGCAVLVGSDAAVRLVPMVNAQDAHHARDPAAFPRTARSAFSLDPHAWLALLRSTEAAGERVLAIAHSHPDGGDRLSAEDRRWAAPDGQALFPGVAHLVVAFRAGRPASARWSLWSEGDVVEWDCPLPEKS
ncbi:MAG: Mov34/MPN/PAD-1 family protein [Myxococcaceae bacterium]